ncbi:hypothetical protein AN958_01361 [Leucoagaricus sp. SymC.cos]|nr:hypothetical protein AN958_01361 [Leucoagaricus sp. SymC.cos]
MPLHVINAPPSKQPLDLPSADKAFDRRIVNAIEGVRQDDIVIAYSVPSSVLLEILNLCQSHISVLWGPSAPGRLVSLIMDGDMQPLDQTLSEIRAIRARNLPVFGNRLVLIYTPEFQNGPTPERKTIEHIERLLKTMYPNDHPRLHGLLYLHPFADAHLLRSPLPNIRFYHQVCGDTSLKRVRLVLTNGSGGETVGNGRDVTRTTASGAWAQFVSRGSRVHSLKSGRDPAEVTKLISGLVAETKDEDYEILKSDFDTLVNSLGDNPVGKEVTNLLEGTLTQLHNNMHDQGALAAEYIRARERITNIASITRKLKIRVGQQIFAFFVKATPQFVVKDSELPLPTPTKKRNDSDLSEIKCLLSPEVELPPKTSGFDARRIFSWIRRLARLLICTGRKTSSTSIP